MTWAASIIAEFGRSIGMDNLTPSDTPGGAVQMTFGADGLLCLEPTDDDLLIYLAREIPPHETDIKARALALIGPDKLWARPVQVGSRGPDRLLFLVRVPQHEASLATLEEVLEILVRLHAAARTP